MGYYDFDGEPISLWEWAQLFEARSSDLVRWRVGYDEIGDDVRVSTVWLGLDHRFGEGPPLIFETLVSGGPLNDEMERYSTEAEAREGHARYVALCQAEQAVSEAR